MRRSWSFLPKKPVSSKSGTGRLCCGAGSASVGRFMVRPSTKDARVHTLGRPLLRTRWRDSRHVFRTPRQPPAESATSFAIPLGQSVVSGCARSARCKSGCVHADATSRSADTRARRGRPLITHGNCLSVSVSRGDVPLTCRRARGGHETMRQVRSRSVTLSASARGEYGPLSADARGRVHVHRSCAASASCTTTCGLSACLT